MPGQGLHSLMPRPVRQNLSPYIKCRLIARAAWRASRSRGDEAPECRIWKANEVSMLRKYVLPTSLLACAMALAAYVADAQDVKAPASSPSQQGTRPSADGTG